MRFGLDPFVSILPINTLDSKMKVSLVVSNDALSSPARTKMAHDWAVRQ
jgi:hypothetical protein